MKKYNQRKIRSKTAYSFMEVSQLLKIDRQTLRRWIKCGLPLIDPAKPPKLIFGSDLAAFLRAKRDGKKVRLSPNQFYCLGCKRAVYGKDGTNKVLETGKTIGCDNRKQQRNSALCEACNHPVSRLF